MPPKKQGKGPAESVSDMLDLLDDDLDKRKKTAFGKLAEQRTGGD